MSLYHRPWPRGLQAGLACLALLGALGLAAPLLAPYDPTAQVDTLGGRWRPPGTVLARVDLSGGRHLLADRAERQDDGLHVWRRERVDVVPLDQVLNLDGGGVRDRHHFLLGSDHLGRDVFSRWLYATRVSLAIAFCSILLAGSIGIAVGAAAAFAGGWVDQVLMRLVDAFLAFPWIILLITLATFYNTGTLALILLLGCTSWTGVSRLARAEIRGVKDKEYVLAARLLGVPPLRIFFHHILPNVATPLLVDTTLRVGSLILAEAAISFLGLGVMPPLPSWGNMISDARDLSSAGWWLLAVPTLSLVFTVLAVQWTADTLRDVLDPRWQFPVSR
jgi:peptide/nickel transport system permease protein